MGGYRALSVVDINIEKSIVTSLAPERQASGDLAMVCIRFKANHGAS